MIVLPLALTTDLEPLLPACLEEPKHVESTERETEETKR